MRPPARHLPIVMALVAAIALTSCRSAPAPAQERRIEAQAFMSYSAAMIKMLENRDSQTISNVCKFYYRLHGEWPRSAAGLAGTPLADGAPFDPRPFMPMKFEVKPDGALSVRYRSDSPVVLGPDAGTTARGFAKITVAAPSPIGVPPFVPKQPATFPKVGGPGCALGNGG